MQIQEIMKKDKILKMYLIVAIMLGLVLGSFIGYTIAQSSNTFYISTGVYPNGVVTIYKYGVNTYAKNSYGYILAESSNTSYVMDYSIDLLTNGGKLFTKSGDYTIDEGDPRGSDSIMHGLKITQDNIIIEGEGKSTRFIPESKYQRIFSFFDVENCHVRNLCVDGNGVYSEPYPECSDTMIAFDGNIGSFHCSVENVVSLNGEHCDGMGCYLSNDIEFIHNTIRNQAHGIAITLSSHCSAIDNDIELCSGDGIVIGANGFDWTHDNSAIHNSIRNCSINGIEISTNASWNKVESNEIEFCEKGMHIVTFENVISNNIVKGCDKGLVIGYPTYTRADSNIVSGNQFLFSTNATYGYGINEYYGSTWNIYTENICFDNAVFGILINGNATHIDNCWNGTNWIDDYYKP